MRYRLLAVALLAACTDAPTPPASEAPPATPPAAEAPPPAPTTPALDPRRFLVVEGEVTLDGKPATVGTPIGAKAEIVTKKGARAVISVQAESVVEIRENSHLSIGKSARKATSMNVLAGVIWSILPPGKADYEVVTANAVAGVRGTTFFVDASHPGMTALCVCDGEVELAAGKKPQAITTHEEHHGFMITGKGKKAKVKAMGSMKDAESHPNAKRDELKALAPH